MNRSFIVAAITAIISIGSCNSAQKQADRLFVSNTVVSDNENIPLKVPSERKIIRQGSVTFETLDLAGSRSQIAKAASDLNGYISNESSNIFPERTEQMVTVRVPSDKFDLLVAKICEGAGKIESKNINSSDVTEEYIDTESRIKAKKELEKRYLELLHKASTVQEILNIEKEAGKLREEIESVEGRLKVMKDQVELSSLTVTFYQKTVSGISFFPKIGNALKYGWRGLLLFVVGLVSVWPFLIILGCGSWLVLHYTRRKNKTN